MEPLPGVIARVVISYLDPEWITFCRYAYPHPLLQTDRVFDTLELSDYAISWGRAKWLKYLFHSDAKETMSIAVRYQSQSAARWIIGNLDIDIFDWFKLQDQYSWRCDKDGQIFRNIRTRKILRWRKKPSVRRERLLGIRNKWANW